MSRYLSPAKLCTLVIIQLYRGNTVPTDSLITLLSLISNLILIRDSPGNEAPPSRRITSLGSIDQVQECLSKIPSTIPGRWLYDIFLQRVWSLTSFEKLGDPLLSECFASTDEKDTSRLKLLRSSSPIGEFLRRCNLEYSRLPFSDAFTLFEDFVTFRAPSYDAWAKKNQTEAAQLSSYASSPGHPDQYCAPVLLERIEHRRNHDLSSSLYDKEQSDRIVHEQVDYLQTHGFCLPDEMRQQLETMVKGCTALPSGIHFIHFFDSWRAGAYVDAIDHLHRYFDYAVEGNQREIKIYHQYALLHLAILHADFNCYEEAISAMHECIATARENQDVNCLNFALLWLVHLRKAYPDYAATENRVGSKLFVAGEVDILTFLQQKAVEKRDWQQVSTTLLAQAESELAHGGSVVKAIDLSYQASHLNHKYSLSSLSAPQTRLHGAIFARLGQKALLEQNNALLDRVYNGSASKYDVLSSTCSRAYRKAIAGNYKHAFEILDSCDPTSHGNTLKAMNLHTGFMNLVSCRRAIQRGDHTSAEEHLRRLRPLSHLADSDIAFEASTLQIMHLQGRGDYEAALAKIQTCSTEKQNSSSNNLAHCIRLLILKANVWAAAGRPSKSISIVLRAAAAAKSRYLLPLLWEAVAALGVILVDQAEFEAARTLVDSIMPQALEGGDTHLIGKLYSTLVEAHIGLGGQTVDRGADMRRSQERHIAQALKFLNLATEAYDKVENLAGSLDCLAKKAVIYQFRGEEGMAGDMEERYNALLAESHQRNAGTTKVY